MTLRMRVTIDRIEGSRAVLVAGGQTFDVPRALLPADAAEGQVYELEWRRDEGEEARLRAELAERLRRLAGDDDGGDFSL
jgi:hypothetical protein